ncbi:MAG TPA: hypothetical protein DCS93_02740 [Microscillaceae bacterium]|nr:hypothetical protein [Microscillaceae bacterium]
MKIWPYFIALVVYLGCTGQTQPEASNAQPKYMQKIDALFKDFNNKNSPGYAIAITKGNKVLYAKGYGMANLEYDIPIGTQSVFSIASVSKQFTGAAIALLIMDGKLSLEEDVSQYISKLKKYPHKIQIKHLLYNTSGLQDYYRLPRPSGKSWSTFNYFDIEEAIATSLKQDTLLFKPGKQWNYSNVNFMLLTQIVEKATGKKFRDFVWERIFKPLNMTQTLVNDDITNIVKNRVIPYNHRTPENIEAYKQAGIKLNQQGTFIQHWRTSPHYGGSGIMTTVEDLAKWSINFYSKKFGGQKFYDLMHKTIKFEHTRDNQAFGLYLGDFNGRQIVAWDGGAAGISSQLMRFPKEGISIVCLSNLGTGRAFEKVNQIADILISEKVMK